MVRDLADSFAAKLLDGLRAAGLVDAATEPDIWYTPRRLAVRVAAVQPGQADREEEQIGPPARIGIAADGGFTPQAAGFAAKFGLGPEALYRVTTPKGDYVAIRRRIAGRKAAELLAELVPQALAGVDMPRSMKWQPGINFRFIRPLRWICVLLGEEIVPVTVAGLRGGRLSRGHRSLGQAEIALIAPATYAEQLEQNFVIADPERRQRRIEEGIAAALKGTGLRVRQDPGLLETLVNLTEYPTVVWGEFDRAYLELPAEVLVTVMRDHQKYFAVEDGHGKLAPAFLAVMNLDADRDGLIRHGHERVLRARFNDARFFWQTDRKRTLASRLEDLKHVTFQAVLGNYFDKSERNAKLARWIAETHGPKSASADLAERAALWAKCDLTTDLVKEFTELQGIMGGLYAHAEGEDEKLVDAIYCQYFPSPVNEQAPQHFEGAAVAIADKLDTIAGLFAAAEIPSGSRDPFALRRQANGIIEIAIRRHVQLDLLQSIRRALEPYGSVAAVGDRATSADTAGALGAFFRERLEYQLREIDRLAYDTVAAVLKSGQAQTQLDLYQLRDCAQALEHERRQAPERFAKLAGALKRMRNIVRKEKWENEGWQPQLLTEAVEKELAAQIQEKLRSAGGLAGGGIEGYSRYFAAVAALWEPLERFFNEVRVNAEDPAVRANRLALLSWAGKELSRVADFSEIVLAGDEGAGAAPAR